MALYKLSWTELNQLTILEKSGHVALTPSLPDEDCKLNQGGKQRSWKAGGQGWCTKQGERGFRLLYSSWLCESRHCAWVPWEALLHLPCGYPARDRKHKHTLIQSVFTMSRALSQEIHLTRFFVYSLLCFLHSVACGQMCHLCWYHQVVFVPSVSMC